MTFQRPHARSAKLCRAEYGLLTLRGRRVENKARPIDELEEENFQLRKLLLELQTGAGIEREALVSQYQLNKLTPTESRFFWLLWEAKGRAVQRATIHSAMYWETTEMPELKIVDVYVCKLRKHLRILNVPFEIQTIWGRGYILLPVGSNPFSLTPPPSTQFLMEEREQMTMEAVKEIRPNWEESD